MNDVLTLKIKNLPDSPGCYLMKENGQIIYVGKAINLKNRVRSYFEKTDHTPKVAAMVARVDDFDIVLARTELEALLLECNLIKLHRPFYNIRLKDDKGYPYIRVTMNEPFPRAMLARRAEKDGAKYFGPYIGASAVRDVLELLKKTFPLRSCKHALPLSRPIRPCMNHEIGRCLAPCAGLCTEEEYREQVMQAVAFLGGQYEPVVRELKREMADAARTLDYERAAALRDRVRDVESLMQRQLTNVTDGAEQDVVALCQDGLDAMAQVLFIRGGKMVGADNYALPGAGTDAPEEVLADFLLLYYDERKPARQVLCQTLPGDTSALENYLREKRAGACDLLVPQRGDKRALILIAEKNARDALEKRNQDAKIRQERTVGACEELGRAIGMTTPPRRIEGFDISNTQGVLSVASMVVFIDGEPAKSEYRHYRIKTVEGANDFASMNEVLSRRFRRAMSDDPNEKWVMPDLVLIDGGPEQLAFARRAMLEAGADVPMFGLAKRLEEIFLPDQEESILLDRKSPALHLIQRIRDEAHRFAITHHTGLRGKATVHSQLDDIPGVGPARRRALLQSFKSIRAIREADEDALCAIPGMSRPAARAVYLWAHPENEQGEDERERPAQEPQQE